MKRPMALTFLLVALFLVYVSHAWEWSLMDDTNFVLRLQYFTAKFGLFGGVWEHFKDLAVLDRSWGLFRPSWWAYASTLYLLPSPMAYGVRLALFYGIIGLPLLTFNSFSVARRNPWLTGISACLLLCNRPLYEGLSCLSMQEFSGCFFVALGVGLSFREQDADERPRHWSNGAKTTLSLACFLIAAWFKTPFLWFLILYCLGLGFFEKKRVIGGIGLVICAYTLFKAVTWARGGGYTHRFTHLQLSTIMTTVKNLIVPASYTVVLMAGLIFTLIASSKSTVRLKPYWRGYALLVGGVLYLGNLLPWGAFGYYFMGPLFLIGVGFIFTVILRLAENDLSAEKRTIMTGLATFLTCFVVLKSAFKIYFKDEAVRLSRDWALTLPKTGLTLGYNGEEASIRFSQLMEIRTAHGWKNTVVNVPAEATHLELLDYYVISKEATSSKAACQEILLDFKAGQICKSNGVMGK